MQAGKRRREEEAGTEGKKCKERKRLKKDGMLGKVEESKGGKARE